MRALDGLREVDMVTGRIGRSVGLFASMKNKLTPFQKMTTLYTCIQCCSYIGEFQDGVKHGQGIFYYADGSRCVAYYYYIPSTHEYGHTMPDINI